MGGRVGRSGGSSKPAGGSSRGNRGRITESPTGSTALTAIAGVGKRRAEGFEKLGVHAVEDLVELWPRRHRDRTRVTAIGDVDSGGTYTVVGAVRQAAATQPMRGKRPMLRVFVEDPSGTLALVFFNASYLAKQLRPGQRLAASGTVERFGRWLSMSHPDIELLEGDSGPRLGLIPVYPLTVELTQRWLFDLMRRELPALIAAQTDPLPEELRRRLDIVERRWALAHQHFPDSLEQLESARERLVFDEFFRISLAVQFQAGRAGQTTGLRQLPNGPRAKRFLASLPFALTVGQLAAWREIADDLVAPRAMVRLLQGDVGSGKTVVAVLTLLAAVDAGHQAAFMAPTELLADQHFNVLARYLEPIGVRCALLSGQASGRQATLALLATGGIDVVVGTQALLSEQVSFADLGLVVVDEQHRFGVRQRAGLSQKGMVPDLLVMTATPIPRTMALTVFGDLEISRITGMPPGRSPITTRHLTYADRRIAYEAVWSAVHASQRAYVVCPLVNANAEMDLHGAVELAEGMQTMEGWRVGLVHGQLAGDQKSAAMEAFRNGMMDVLVATSIIEVGVDVPEASVIVIENAERFGIAQLHQLRGRVGRGAVASTCYLLSDARTEDAVARLDALVQHQDGLELAELDLVIRGPGEVLGFRQHGVNGFQLARPVADLSILERARTAARELIAIDGELALPQHQALKAWMWEAIEASQAQQVLN